MIKNYFPEQGMVICVYNLGTKKSKWEEQQIWGQPELYRSVWATQLDPISILNNSFPIIQF